MNIYDHSLRIQCWGAEAGESRSRSFCVEPEQSLNFDYKKPKNSVNLAILYNKTLLTSLGWTKLSVFKVCLAAYKIVFKNLNVTFTPEAGTGAGARSQFNF